MGAHKGNPVAIAHANSGPRPLVETNYGYQMQVVIEPNKAKMAEITAFLDAEKAAGKAPQEIDLKFELKPEEQDYVVYHVITEARVSRLATPDGKVPQARVRWGEHLRVPLKEVQDRAQMAFDGGPGTSQA